MKSIANPMAVGPEGSSAKLADSRRGFALVVTLSLMMLLAIVAIGLLTLSSVSLRASAQGDAIATARTNACTRPGAPPRIREQP